jgi:hypothetical protein
MRRLKLPMAAGMVVVLAAAVATGCAATPLRTADLARAANERPALDAPDGTTDPTLTQQACTAAALSTVDSTRLFNNQMAVIERAAADDDTRRMIAAANRIQLSFVQLAQGLAVLSAKPVNPEVAQTLRAGSQAMSEISSNTYAGSTADINTRLTELTASVLTACA